MVAYAGAWVLYFLSFTKVNFKEKVQRLVEPRAFSHELASNDFGYSPMSFEEGIEKECNEYLHHKYR